jgi:PAS domain S-box-containing protein
MNKHPPPLRPPPFEAALAVLVATMGVLVLWGWSSDIGALRSVLTRHATMKPNTALALVLCGGALTLSRAGRKPLWRQLALLPALAVMLIGALSLGQELLGSDFGIDEMLFRDGGAASGDAARPGRMSPVTAFCLLSLGLAVALTALPSRLRLQFPLAAALGATAMVVAALALTDRLSDSTPAFLLGSAKTMALYTALGLMTLGLAVLLSARQLQGRPWALGKRTTLGLLIGVLLMLGSAQLVDGFVRDRELVGVEVEQTQRALHRLEQMEAELGLIESGQRAYLWLADESLLNPRAARIAAVRAHLASLAQAPVQALAAPERLQMLLQMVDARLAFGDRLIELRRSQGFEAARAIFASGQGIELSARIGQLLTPMMQLQRQQLEQRQARLSAVTETGVLLLPIGSLTSLSALLAALFFFEHSVIQSQLATRTESHNRARLQVVFDSMTEGVRVVDQTQQLVQANPTGATLHGLIEPTYTVGMAASLVDILTLEGETVAADQWPASRALRGEHVHEQEFELRRKDNGLSRVVAINTARLPTPPGEPLQVVVTSHDITKRRLAEAAARIAGQRLQLVVENLAEGLVVHGLDGELLHWNRAALAMLELNPGQTMMTSRRDFSATHELSALDGTALALHDWPMSRLLRGESLPQQQVRVRHLARGWVRVLSVGGSRVHDAGGQPLVFLTFSDVTARSAAEQQLQSLNAELEQRVEQRTAEVRAKSRELESFCYSVSHDLKAPLRGIDGYSRLLLEEYADQLDADGQQFIAKVRQATTQMTAKIDDLLAYSQQELRTFVPDRIGLARIFHQYGTGWVRCTWPGC